jgi:hypothetical protein
VATDRHDRSWAPGRAWPGDRARVIEAHGGRIWAEPGFDPTYPGSAFHVVLPLHLPVQRAEKKSRRLGDHAGIGSAEAEAEC